MSINKTIQDDQHYRILLTGGGTGGSVTPLLAAHERLKEHFPNATFVFVGSKAGIEQALVEEAGIPFRGISSGKWRRYIDARNVIDPWYVAKGFVSSLGIMVNVRPHIVLSAGSYVSVPVVAAARFHRIPVVVHQQDCRKGLANRLMTPFATKITVTFQKSLHDFPKGKTVWTGNPVRRSIVEAQAERAYHTFGLEKGLPTLLILGGGTGALHLNAIVDQSLAELTEMCQIIHVAGKGKNIFQPRTLSKEFQPHYRGLLDDREEHTPRDGVRFDRYHVSEFLTDEIGDAIAVADLVATRAGLGTLTELSALGKSAIVIPIADSHQEANAALFSNAGAAITLSEKTLTPQIFANHVKQLLSNPAKLADLSAHMKTMTQRDSTSRFVKVVEEILIPLQ